MREGSEYFFRSQLAPPCFSLGPLGAIEPRRHGPRGPAIVVPSPAAANNYCPSRLELWTHPTEIITETGGFVVIVVIILNRQFGDSLERILLPHLPRFLCTKSCTVLRSKRTG